MPDADTTLSPDAGDQQLDSPGIFNRPILIEILYRIPTVREHITEMLGMIDGGIDTGLIECSDIVFSCGYVSNGLAIPVFVNGGRKYGSSCSTVCESPGNRRTLHGHVLSPGTIR
jgi:hypothetical protein